MSSSVLVGVIGICLAYFIYMVHGKDLPAKLAQTYKLHYDLIYNKYYVDEIYYVMVVLPIYHFSVFLWKVIDAFFIDGVGVNGAGWLVRRSSAGLRYIQNGYMQTYGAYMCLGVVVILWFFLGAH
jgi:NADH-quinone oxidoreductase subunit L